MQYQIEALVSAVPGLRNKLQTAYDRGAAGFFNLVPMGEGILVKFDRELTDDHAYIQSRVDDGVPYAQAAKEQLAAELEEANWPDVREVVLALKGPSARVFGLSEWDFRAAS